MREFIIDRRELISESIDAIENYLQNIESANDFRKDGNGSLRLDAIMMRLQAIAENVKKISNLENDFFASILNYDTNNIIRFRDFISHHYEKSDSEIIFGICKEDIPFLKAKINHFLK